VDREKVNRGKVKGLTEIGRWGQDTIA